MASPRCFFLDLPCEIRLDIYALLLLIHPPLDRVGPSSPQARLHPAILSTNRQIHREGTPILYGSNVFLAHTKLLASFPRLRPWYSPVRERSVLPRIRRFHIRLRLDCDLAFDAAAATAAFNGVDELIIEVWQAAFQSADHGALRVFEGVRAVKTVRVYGSIIGFEDYVGWLEGVMRRGGELEGSKDISLVGTRPSQSQIPFLDTPVQSKALCNQQTPMYPGSFGRTRLSLSIRPGVAGSYSIYTVRAFLTSTQQTSPGPHYCGGRADVNGDITPRGDNTGLRSALAPAPPRVTGPLTSSSSGSQGR